MPFCFAGDSVRRRRRRQMQCLKSFLRIYYTFYLINCIVCRSPCVYNLSVNTGNGLFCFWLILSGKGEKDEKIIVPDVRFYFRIYARFVQNGRRKRWRARGLAQSRLSIWMMCASPIPIGKFMPCAITLGWQKRKLWRSVFARLTRSAV